LLSVDQTTTMIAAEANDEKEFRDITLIPTGCIISVKELTSDIGDKKQTGQSQK